jgi:hypothetical protein
MPFVNVRLLEMRTDERRSFVNKLMLDGVTTSNLIPVSHDIDGPGLLRCKRIWQFAVARQDGECLTLLLVKRIVFAPNRALGRCSLPLDWFASDRLTREWFPLTNTDGGAGLKAMLLLDVHIATAPVKPFSAPFSSLRVVPTWARPVEAYAECPAPPQLIFVVPHGMAPESSLRCPTVELVPRDGGWGQSNGAFYPSVEITGLAGSGHKALGVPPVLA